MGMNCSANLAYGFLVIRNKIIYPNEYEFLEEHAYTEEINYSYCGHYDYSEEIVVYLTNTLESVEWGGTKISNIYTLGVPNLLKGVPNLLKIRNEIINIFGEECVEEPSEILWSYYG